MSPLPPPATLAIPFTYRVDYKARSWTNERHVSFAATAEVSLAHVAPEDAPVALRLACASRDAYGRNPFRPKADGAPRDVRWIEDGFWVEGPALESLAETLAAAASAEKTPFAECVDTHAFRAGPTVFAKDRYGRTTKKPDMPSGVQTAESLHAYEEGIRYITDDGGASVAATIAAAAARCRVVDGVVYESIPEPVLALSSYGRGLSLAVAPDAGHGFRALHILSGAGFARLDEADALLATAEKRGEEPVPRPHVEIVRPDLLLHHPMGDACVQEAKTLRDDMARHQRGLPTAWLGPAAALWGSLAASPRLPTPALARALRGLADMPLPTRDEAVHLRWLAARRGDASAADTMLEGLGRFRAAAASLHPMAARLSDALDRPGRLDASVVSLWSEEGRMSSARLRPARSREDLRRAARLLGERFADLEARFEADPDLDILLHEGPALDVSPAKDMALVGVVEVDLANGVVARFAGDEPDGTVLADHLDRAWPGNRPEPAPQALGPSR